MADFYSMWLVSGPQGIPGNNGSNGTNGADAELPRRVRVAYTGTDYTWTYPIAFAAGVVPVVEAIVEVPDPYTGNANVMIIGIPTNTSCKFRINNQAAASISLVGLLSLTLFQQAPNTVFLHLTARNP